MKPSIAKGTRDFLPHQVIKRKYIFDIIKTVFETYGYVPIETPSFELLSTLTGKYGEEGDRLLFKILNNGDFLGKADEKDLCEKNSKKIVSQISKRGLRYDLTVPFARFVVMHENDLTFPFKRYQIQPVWRADRPQKGRYQEFYQCDVDAIGSDSLMYEAELVKIYDDVFTKLKIPIQIRINNRKVLEEMSIAIGAKDKFIDITIAIDKLDKIGMEGVEQELSKRGLNHKAIESIKSYLEIDSIGGITDWFEHQQIDSEGLKELKTVFNYLYSIPLHNHVIYDATLARGLNYYTGCILEVKATDAEIGSLGGGGRYDELTEVFDRKGMSGVGISFGAERIYDIMEEKNLFPGDLIHTLDILFVTFDEFSHKEAFKLASNLRHHGIKTDIYPAPAKMKKQMKYADAIGVPYVAILGGNEMEKRVVSLKNMETGEQKEVAWDDLKKEISSNH
jgi:histidyl-tRNA synthetase